MSVELLVLGGSAAGQSVDVGDRTTIGSAPGCTLRLADAGVEALHATLERRGDRYRLRSTAGVWLDGRPMLEAVPRSVTRACAYRRAARPRRARAGRVRRGRRRCADWASSARSAATSRLTVWRSGAPMI